MRIGPVEFESAWVVDFEFHAPDGERPGPICMVAREVGGGGRAFRLGRDELKKAKRPPFPTGPGNLLVGYYTSAEVGCFLSLGWPEPARVLDLYVEFRLLTNGRDRPCGAGLLGALSWYGLDAMGAAEKKEMRDLAIRGGPWSTEEQKALLDYCEDDVVCTARLLERMLPDLDVPRALLRGRYMIAAARMERAGIPIDTGTLTALRDNWTVVQEKLIEQIDSDYGVFEGRTFKAERWARWLATNGIPWPRLASGALALDDDTFREIARTEPRVAPMRELRVSLSQMRLSDLAVGEDGRNRCLLSAFAARTGRNQPSNSRFIFGPAVWLRQLIRPESGMALAYVDYSQQEFGIAAALSGDAAMMDAYASGDPYLAFAKQAGAVPPDATKASHSAVREQFKAAALAVQYGMEAEALGQRIGQPVAEARELLRLHRGTYRQFWRWSDAAVDHADLRGSIHTVFGWRFQTSVSSNPRMLRNFPMQANGAEMLRLSCCLATERGIEVCAPVHDALLVEAPLDRLEQVVTRTQQAMAEASEGVLSGFRLRSEPKLIRHPDRYSDARGVRMWDSVQQILQELAGTGTPRGPMSAVRFPSAPRQAVTFSS